MRRRSILTVSILVIAFVAFASRPVEAKPSEFDLISQHLKRQYHAKKVHIPFMWLARAAVRVVRPAGVKSFNVTLFDGLKFSMESLDNEMQRAMRSSFGPEWSSIFHARSRDGQQAYMYMREDGPNIKVAVVTIEKEQAALIRATFSPDKLAQFINDPKIFGISLSDDDDKKALQPPAAH